MHSEAPDPQRMFARWNADLRASGFPGTDGPSFGFHFLRERRGFGAWLHASGPAIRLTADSFDMLRELVRAVVSDPAFTVPDQLFSGSGEEDRGPTADLMLELAFQWLMAHEVSHWLLGHPEFLQRNEPPLTISWGLAETGFGAADGDGGIDRHENICAELQADSNALEILDHLYAGDFPAALYQTFPGLSGEDRSFLRRRLVTTSAGLVMLLIDTIGSRENYPGPPARVFNLLKMSFALANQEAMDFSAQGPFLSGHDDRTLETLKRSLHEIIMPAGLDLQIVSRHLGTETTFVDFHDGKSRALNDLLISSNVRQGEYETEGGREFAIWEEILYAEVREKWLPFSRIETWTTPPEA